MCQAHGIILLVLALVNSKVGMLCRIPEVSFSLNNYFGFLPFPSLNTLLIIYGQLYESHHIQLYVMVVQVDQSTSWFFHLIFKNTGFKTVIGKQNI